MLIRKIAIFCALLVLVVPVTSVLADDDPLEVTTGDDYTIGVDDGGSQTGNSSSGSSSSENGSESATDSSLTDEEKLAIQIQNHNQEVSDDITNAVTEMIRDSNGNVIGYRTPHGVVYTVTFASSVSAIRGIVDNADYLEGPGDSPADPVETSNADTAYSDAFADLIANYINDPGSSDNFSEDPEQPLISIPPYTSLSIRPDYTINDEPTFRDRYQTIDTYLDTITTKDTVEVQYIIEYRLENVQQSVITYIEPFSDLYTWNIYQSDENGVFDSSVSYLNFTVPDKVIENPIREVGWYTVTCSTQAAVYSVDALQYSVYEYWVIKDTGQVIWKRCSTGNTGDYDADINARTGDVKVGYVNWIISPPQMVLLPFSASTPTINDARTECLIHVLDGNLGSGYLGTGGLSDDNWTTKRID